MGWVREEGGAENMHAKCTLRPRQCVTRDDIQHCLYAGKTVRQSDSARQTDRQSVGRSVGRSHSLPARTADRRRAGETQKGMLLNGRQRVGWMFCVHPWPDWHRERERERL
eukprot:GHVU01156596.1.p1 GENE.GHVU01156596.1~~GHVU01156596.1.p1  ORF type:complete len:111 (+),score=9.00 GHVU01156596.1:452-784(+)